MYITRLSWNEIFSRSNKIHGEVGRAKDLSAPRYNKTNEGCNWIGHIMLRNCLLKQVRKNERDVKTRKKT